VSDYFPFVLTYDLAMSNDGGVPIVWLTAGASIVGMNPSGTILSTTATGQVARAITASAPNPKTTLWYTEASFSGTAWVGRLNYPTLVRYPITSAGELFDIVEGPDNNIWFTDAGNNQVASLTPDGATLSTFALPTAASTPYGITSGPDGKLWFTERDNNKIGILTTAGDLTEICIPTADSAPSSIAAGPDGNVWFTESSSGKIGRVEIPAAPGLAPADSDPEAAEGDGSTASSEARVGAEGASCSISVPRSSRESLYALLGLGALVLLRRRERQAV
jgi:virginiamycin B lyase